MGRGWGFIESAIAAGPGRPRRRLAAALWGVLLGAGLQVVQPQLSAAGTYAAALALGGVLALVAWKCRGQWSGMWWLLAAAALVWGWSGLRASQQWSQRLDPALEGVDIEVQGVVVQMPVATPQGLRLRLQVESAQRPPAAQPVALPPLVDLAWYRASAWSRGTDAAPLPDVHAGQRWRMVVRLRAPHGNLNPHGFDYEQWLWEQGVQAVGYVREPAPQLLAATGAYPVERLRQRVRDAMVARLVPADPVDPSAPAAQERQRIAGVLVALVTGEQRAIDREDWRLFRTTGVAHLMAISGLHITLFAWVATLAIGALWRRSAWLCLRWPAPYAALAGGVLAAAAYAVFSGWGVPAQRTVLMLAVVVLLRLAGRQWPWHATWLLACAVVVAVQPLALLQAGFWLSFVAVGMLFASDFVAGGARVSSAGGHFYRIFKEQWVATVALTPLSLLLFGQVSVVGLLANLLAIPWVTWVVTLLALLGTLAPPLWDAAAWAMQPLVAGLRWLAQWPHAAVWLPAAPWWAAGAAVAGGLWLVLPLPAGLRSLGLPLLLPALCWQPLRPAEGQFRVLALDVGQGQAVLVQTARHQLLYDAGPQYGVGSNAGDRLVVPTLRALGGPLDALLLSHADTDHTGGAEAVITQLAPAQVLGSLPPMLEARYRALLPAGGTYRSCVAGMAWDWDGVRFSVLHPFAEAPVDEAARPGGRESTNARSCVLRVQASAADGGKGAVALLAGDLERPQELQLVQRSPEPLAADLLTAPHHGSKTSSSAPFLQAVSPRLAVAQAGYRNRFGHPAAEVAERYRAQGIPLAVSDACGALAWESAAPASWRCEREASRHFWRHDVHRNGAAAGAVQGVEAW
ncbi:DNA internalization-related competence protein ComEC/Rec2 [Comamonas humi]